MELKPFETEVKRKNKKNLQKQDLLNFSKAVQDFKLALVMQRQDWMYLPL